MKKILFAIAFVAFTSFIAQSQTTETEYNYITKGLIDDLSKGKDIKEGYSMVKIMEESKLTYGDNSWRSVTVHFFKKAGANKAFIVECRDNANNKRYMCIPTANASESVWQMAFNEFNGTTAIWHMVFIWALAKLASAKLL